GVGMAMGMQMGNQLSQQMQAETTVRELPKDSPPPIPKLYYVMILGEREGPISLPQLYRHLEQGDIGADTLIWRKGMVEWQPIKDSPEIDLSQIPPTIK
ncbi:MAG: DUF4339 domain-containing protein, partial [Ostreibacterium sp.]